MRTTLAINNLMVVPRIGVLLLGGALCICINAQAQAVSLLAGNETAWHPFTKVDSLTFTAPLPIKPFLTDWDAPLVNGNRALTLNRVAAGAVRGPLEIAAIARYDYWLSFTHEAAELYYASINGQEIDAGRSYQVQIHVNHFTGYGARARQQWQPTAGVTLRLAGSLFHASDLMDGELDGTARRDLAGNDQVDARVHYFYSDDVLFDRAVSRPRGWGVGADVGVSYVRGRLAIDADVDDAFARIYWAEAPYTDAVASSHNDAPAQDGSFALREPAVSGFEGNVDYTQRMPWLANVHAGWRVSSAWGLVARATTSDLVDFVRFGFSAHAGGGEWELLWSGVYDAATASYSAAHAQFSITSDSLVVRDAHLFAVSARLVWPW